MQTIPGRDSGELKILLIDDSPTDRLIALEALEGAGFPHSVQIAENGVEAMSLLNRTGKYQQAQRPDIILLDLNMPKMDGREVLSTLKSDPDLRVIPVIVLTTSSADEDVLRAYGDYANSYITKPVDFPRFAAAVAALGIYWQKIVTLPPRSQAERRNPTGLASALDDDAPRSMRVLLVEDNPLDVLLLREALDQSAVGRFELTHATRLSEARKLVESQRFDVLITDLGLPDGQGIDTYRKMKAFAGALPVIVLTGGNDESVGLSALREGAQDYLVKGQVTGAALARAIRYAVDRQKIEEQLRHSQRMDALGQLAGGIAHDFNNLLTVIQGHASLLDEGASTPEEAAESTQEILEAAGKAAGLTRQLLTFSRRQVMRTKVIGLNQAVTDFTRMLSRVLGEHITLSLDLWPAELYLRGDLGMLEQVLLNLGVNGRDAMPLGGTLSIVTEPGVVDNFEEGGSRCVVLKFSDTGCGMTPEVLKEIFDPFFTTKDVGKGTGLGLATVYSIVQQHNGRIEVRSQPGRGATFTLSFPSESQPAKAEILSGNGVKPPSSFSQPPQNRAETILLVEDEVALRAMTRKCLERNGYRVLEAGSGPEARSVWDNHSGSIDLLFTDMVMPEGQTGRQLGEELLALDSRLLVVYTSGYSKDFSAGGFSLQEGINFLQKPYSIAAMLGVMRSRLDSRNTLGQGRE